LSNAISSVLIDLAAEWGVHELEGMTEEQLEVVAVRLMVETQDRPTARYLRKIAVEVKRAGDGQAKTGSCPESTVEEPASPAHRRPVFLATERTTRARLEREAEAKTRLARQFLVDDKRTGLFIVPRRPGKHPSAVHELCLVAYRDGGNPCSSCLWLLDDEPYTDAHLDDADDGMGRM
jgi:hypothetical protein